jgi:hypothetical protein
MLESGREVAAIWELQAGLKLEPDNALARYRLGEAYWKLGERGLASEQFRQSSELAGESETGRMSRARLAELGAAPVSGGGPHLVARPGTEFRECADCPLMVVVEAGAHRLDFEEIEGGAHGKEVRSDDKGPAPLVRMQRFAISKYEITKGQWRAVMEAGRGGRDGCWDDCPPEDVEWSEAGSQSRGSRDEEVMASVDWPLAEQFIRKLNHKVSGSTLGPYRVPYEAEWAYACYGAGNDGVLLRCGENVLEWVDRCIHKSIWRGEVEGSSGDCRWRVARAGRPVDVHPHLTIPGTRSKIEPTHGNGVGLRVVRMLQ